MGQHDNGNVSGSTTDFVTIAELIEHAQSFDPSVSGRTLEHWRAKHLLPPAVRVGYQGRSPVWGSAKRAVPQLERLLVLRKTTDSVDVLLVCLWWEGYLVEPRFAKEALVRVLRHAQSEIEKEFAKRRQLVGSDEEAVKQLAEKFAGLRKGNGLPRLRRQTKADREVAAEAVMRLAFGLTISDDELQDAQPKIDRLLGLDQMPWRQASAADSSDVEETALSGFAQVGSIQTLIAVAKSATDEELLEVQTLGRMFFGGIVTLSRLHDFMAGRANSAGTTVLQAFENEPSVAIMLVPLIISMRRQPENAASFATILQTIESDVLGVQQRLLELSRDAAAADEWVSQMPFGRQALARELLANERKRIEMGAARE